jgi:hypothetical protein
MVTPIVQELIFTRDWMKIRESVQVYPELEKPPSTFTGIGEVEMSVNEPVTPHFARKKSAKRTIEFEIPAENLLEAFAKFEGIYDNVVAGLQGAATRAQLAGPVSPIVRPLRKD